MGTLERVRAWQRCADATAQAGLMRTHPLARTATDADQ
jgi:hypothetical protein